jgi:hypothetical protein
MYSFGESLQKLVAAFVLVSFHLSQVLVAAVCV